MMYESLLAPGFGGSKGLPSYSSVFGDQASEICLGLFLLIWGHGDIIHDDHQNEKDDRAGHPRPSFGVGVQAVYKAPKPGLDNFRIHGTTSLLVVGSAGWRVAR